MKDIEKEVYAHLGLLSIQFARMEQMLLLIVSGLLGGDKLLSRKQFEYSGIDEKLKRIEKLAIPKGVDMSKIRTLKERIEGVRKERNLFTHGVWFEPYEQYGTIVITCSDMKIFAEKNAPQSEWAEQTHYTYALEDIQMKIGEIKEIQGIQREILEQIKRL